MHHSAHGHSGWIATTFLMYLINGSKPKELMMFMRTKIVNGKEYKSWESRKRVNGKVVSIYHGPVHLPGERAAAIAIAK